MEDVFAPNFLIGLNGQNGDTYFMETHQLHNLVNLIIIVRIYKGGGTIV